MIALAAGLRCPDPRLDERPERRRTRCDKHDPHFRAERYLLSASPLRHKTEVVNTYTPKIIRGAIWSAEQPCVSSTDINTIVSRLKLTCGIRCLPYPTKLSRLNTAADSGQTAEAHKEAKNELEGESNAKLVNYDGWI